MKTEEKSNSVATAKKTLVKLAMDSVQRKNLAMIELEGADDVAAAVEMKDDGLGKLVFLPKQRKQWDWDLQPEAGGREAGGRIEPGFDLVEDESGAGTSWEDCVLAVSAEINESLAADLMMLATEAMIYRRDGNVERVEAIMAKCEEIRNKVGVADARHVASQIAWHWIHALLEEHRARETR